MSKINKEILSWSEELIPVGITYRRRQKNTRISMVINILGELRITAPPTATKAQILQMLTANKEWISRSRQQQQQKLAGRQPLSYNHNSCFYFLGTAYKLQWSLSTDITPGIYLAAGVLTITAKNLTAARVRRELEQWYRNRALTYFAAELKNLIETNAALNWVETVPTVKVRKMKRQWGNCSAQGVLTLNIHLIKLPPGLIRYVLVHELCHLREANHGPRFYQLMTAAVPAWRGLRQELKKHIFHLLEFS